MNTRPIPVPPQGSRLHWHLDQPFRLKHLVIAVLILALLLITGHRTEMDRMVTMTTQAVGNLVGLNDESQVVRGLSKVADSMWPPQMATSEQVARINDFNANDIPLFARVENRETTTQRLNEDTLQLESTTETT